MIERNHFPGFHFHLSTPLRHLLRRNVGAHYIIGPFGAFYEKALIAKNLGRPKTVIHQVTCSTTLHTTTFSPQTRLVTNR